jgi:hypothetical protein
VRKWFEDAFLDLWGRFHVEIEELTGSSRDRVLLGLLLTGQGRDSGVETEARAWNVFWVVDGRIAKRQLFRIEDRDAALEAAGLRG